MCTVWTSKPPTAETQQVLHYKTLSIISVLHWMTSCLHFTEQTRNTYFHPNQSRVVALGFFHWYSGNMGHFWANNRNVTQFCRLTSCSCKFWSLGVHQHSVTFEEGKARRRSHTTLSIPLFLQQKWGTISLLLKQNMHSLQKTNMSSLLQSLWTRKQSSFPILHKYMKAVHLFSSLKGWGKRI